MDPKLRDSLIRELRRYTFRYKPRNAAKKKQYRAPATYECQECGIWTYVGTRDLEILDLSPPNGLMKGKAYLDHIEPVIEPSKGWIDWNTYMDRLFCEESGFQVLCKPCHSTKTKQDTEIRTKAKKAKKLLTNKQK